jgi:integrase
LEIASLTWDDMLPDRRITVRVDPFPRIVPIAAPLWDRLTHYRQSKVFYTDPLFPSRIGGGNFMSARQIARIVQDIGKRAGIDANVNKLRNSHAQHALARGASLEDVQAIMRHTTARTTVRHQTRQPVKKRSIDVLL